MQRDLFRILCGLISIAAGLVWVTFLFLFGGKFLAEVQSPSLGPLGIALISLVSAAALGFVILFAAGIMSMRAGPPRPRLWLACIVAGTVTCLAAWWLTLLLC
jgi:hypothetical protein